MTKHASGQFPSGGWLGGERKERGKREEELEDDTACTVKRTWPEICMYETRDSAIFPCVKYFHYTVL
jgi:hypothetical protein